MPTNNPNSQYTIKGTNNGNLPDTFPFGTVYVIYDGNAQVWNVCTDSVDRINGNTSTPLYSVSSLDLVGIYLNDPSYTPSDGDAFYFYPGEKINSIVESDIYNDDTITLTVYDMNPEVATALGLSNTSYEVTVPRIDFLNMLATGGVEWCGMESNFFVDNDGNIVLNAADDVIYSAQDIQTVYGIDISNIETDLQSNPSMELVITRQSGSREGLVPVAPMDGMVITSDRGWQDGCDVLVQKDERRIRYKYCEVQYDPYQTYALCDRNTVSCVFLDNPPADLEYLDEFVYVDTHDQYTNQVIRHYYKLVKTYVEGTTSLNNGIILNDISVFDGDTAGAVCPDEPPTSIYRYVSEPYNPDHEEYQYATQQVIDDEYSDDTGLDMYVTDGNGNYYFLSREQDRPLHLLGNDGKWHSGIEWTVFQ